MSDVGGEPDYATRSHHGRGRGNVMTLPLACAICFPFLALAMQWLLWPWLAPYIWFLFYPAVYFSARVGSSKGGMASAVLSVVMVWVFFVSPQLSFAKDNLHALPSACMFLVMGYFFSENIARPRAQIRRLAHICACRGLPDRGSALEGQHRTG